jgi:conjugative relaxase-like TrwC/TraI family protein
MTDVTVDVNKPVTLAALYDDRVEGAVNRSLRKTITGYIEPDICVRVRKGGKDEDRESGNGLYVIWPHETTRPEDGRVDPHKHRHVTFLNVSYDPVEKTNKACQFGDIVRDKRYYQAVFNSYLAAEMKALGYGIEKDGNNFRLAGLSRATVEKFSRRTATINAEAERLGITDAASKSKLGRRTREKKSKKPVSMEDLQKEWDGRLTPEERLALKTAGSGWAKGDDLITPEQAKEYALEHSFQNASAVSEKRLKAEALTYAVGSIKPEDIADIAQHSEVIAETRGGQLMTTTKTVLDNEIAFLQFAKDGQRKQRVFGDCTDSDALAGLSEEQKKAALHILNSRDTVTGVVGRAGTGKTRMMRSTIDAIHGASGQKVFVFAPSSQASRGVLKKEGFSNAETLEMLLKSEKLQDQTKGQVLWVDEAGLVSSKDMRRLMDVAKKNGNRVILSGDYTQHSSVEAGDAFRLLEKEAGVRLARLTEIRRQTEPGYRKAVEQISQGTGKAARQGFDVLDKMGCVVEASGEERHRMLVKDYLKAQDEGRSALIIAPTHAEGDRLTAELREALKERGALGKERTFTARKSTGWTNAQKSDSRNYEPGMVLEWHQNAKGFTRGEKAVVTEGEDGLALLKQDGTSAAIPSDKTDRFEVYRTREIAIAKGDRIRPTKNGEAKVEGQAKGTRVNNGDIFTVEGFTKEGDIRIGKDKLLPKDWGHMSFGYVDTSYASQGKTVDRVFVALGNQSIPAANVKQWYVSLSRGREMAKVYVEDKQDVRGAIAKGEQRLSAVELTHTKLRPAWRTRLQETLERNRVGRYLRQRATAIADYWRDRGREVRYA